MQKNYQNVFDVFKKRYIPVPLEIFRDPYTTLISTVLSTRTRDEVTLGIAKRLFDKAPDIYKLHTLSQKEIEKLITGVGFYRVKAKHIKKLARIIVEEKEGRIPNTVEELLKLPGVGIKTANLTLNRAFSIPAISVDTHVHRISNLLGWVQTKTPEQTEKELKKILPKKYWKNINRYMVSLGRQFPSKKNLIRFLKENELMK